MITILSSRVAAGVASRSPSAATVEEGRERRHRVGLTPFAVGHRAADHEPLRRDALIDRARSPERIVDHQAGHLHEATVVGPEFGGPAVEGAQGNLKIEDPGTAHS